MAQITIYVDDRTLEQVDQATKSSGVSKSKWITESIQLRLRAEWPESVKALAGAWKDFPLAEEIRAKQGKDSRREKL
ncbi:MAG: CopG family transcriptional regulator [Acidobacteria bacterium]|nr:CopG family transcriptional regulator [Acidobacteriota bacterium]